MSARFTPERAASLTVLCVAGAAAPLAAPLITEAWPTLRWVVDLAAHWQWLYLGVAGACALNWLVRRRWRWLPAALVVPLPAVVAALEAPPEHGRGAAAAPVLTVVSANLHMENQRLDLVQAWVNAIDADILVLQEVTPEHAVTLEGWQDYPHRVIAAQYSPFGMAVLSRHPLAAADPPPAGDEPPGFRILLAWNGRAVALASVHPMPPISAADHVRGVAALTREAGWAAAAAPLAVLAGDLNASPWGLAFAGARSAGLVRASPLAPTWPAPTARFGLGIPIDHVLVGPGWSAVGGGRGPRVGSDHLPVYVRLAPLES